MIGFRFSGNCTSCNSRRVRHLARQWPGWFLCTWKHLHLQTSTFTNIYIYKHLHVGWQKTAYLIFQHVFFDRFKTGCSACSHCWSGPTCGQRWRLTVAQLHRSAQETFYTFLGHLSSHRSRPCILVFYKTPEKVLLLTDWSFSPGGIFDGCDYAQNMDLNHVVQMVGDSLFLGEKKLIWTYNHVWYVQGVFSTGPPLKS